MEPLSPFAHWLNVTMQSRGLSQAAVARALGVADTQVSRWRRGQVVPTVRYLQQIADVFGVPRLTLDVLAGYPPGAPDAPDKACPPDVATLAELQAYQARYRQVLEERVPRPLWRAYMESCEALASGLVSAFDAALDAPAGGEPGGTHKDARNIGFRHRERGDAPRE